ncbi:MAG: hypothetical protein AAGD13_05830 [Pseudomonadota bacterium]
MSVSDDEEVVRLLFNPQMIDDHGSLIEETCFPTQELVEKNGKSCSVLRSALLVNKTIAIDLRLQKMANPDKNRLAYGYAEALCAQIHAIQDHSGKQIFKVFEDSILKDGTHDKAHAKLVRASPKFSKNLVRGYRDKLVEAFSKVNTRNALT